MLGSAGCRETSETSQNGYCCQRWRCSQLSCRNYIRHNSYTCACREYSKQSYHKAHHETYRYRAHSHCMGEWAPRLSSVCTRQQLCTEGRCIGNRRWSNMFFNRVRQNASTDIVAIAERKVQNMCSSDLFRCQWGVA